MSTPTNPTIASVADAKQQSGSTAMPVELPSGLWFLVRRPGVESFIKAGIVPNSLLGVVQEALAKGQDEKAAEVELSAVAKELTSMEQVGDIMTLTDDVVVRCVVQPAVSPTTKRDEIQAREDLTEEEKMEHCNALLFVDEVKMEDKLFLFNYVTGGTADLATFRESASAGVAAVLDSDSAAPKAKRPSRPKR